MSKVVKSSRYYLLRGDNKSWLDRMPKNYVDSVVTDPHMGSISWVIIGTTMCPR